MTIIPFGDCAVLINFQQIIDQEINTRVVALANAIASDQINGVSYCVPAYCSITVAYQPDVISFGLLIEKLKLIYTSLPDRTTNNITRRIKIPVCYHEEFAMDRDEIVAQTQLTWENIKAIHTGQEYRVYMLGFIAGFAYMGTLPEAIKCSRKSTPRLHIPAGTVGIAGLQTGIYPKEAHAGWQLLGRTPIPIFEAMAVNPFLLDAGDLVKFHEIDLLQYESISNEVLAGNFNLKSVIAHG